jgi:hypothetical protein
VSTEQPAPPTDTQLEDMLRATPSSSWAPLWAAAEAVEVLRANGQELAITHPMDQREGGESTLGHVEYAPASSRPVRSAMPSVR